MSEGRKGKKMEEKGKGKGEMEPPTRAVSRQNNKRADKKQIEEARLKEKNTV